MIVEKAHVVATDRDYVLVHTERQSVCGHCAVNKGCGTSVLARVVGRRYARIRVVNRYKAKVGDTVTIGMSEAGFLKSALIVYAVPLLAVVASAAVTTAVLGPGLSETAGIVSGAAGFTLGVAFARWFALRQAANPDYHPVILSVEHFAPERASSASQGLLAP